MKKTIRFLIFTLLAVLLAGCQFMQKDNSTAHQVVEEESFPFPAIPAMITAPEERAAYLLTHYWEKVDFGKHVLGNQDSLMEQGFVDFLSVFPHAIPSVLHESANNMIQHALVDSSRVRPLVDLVEDYLYHPNSPMLNEDYFRVFLEEFLKVDKLSFSVKEELKFHLATVNKNKVGDKVANFTFLTNQNRSVELYQSLTSVTLLFFYDADCNECKHVLSQMKENKDLGYLTQTKQLKIITICVEGSREQWRAISNQFPRDWVKGKVDDTSSILEDFVFRAMPTIYLLDQDKKVLLKDVLWGKLLAYIEAQKG